MNFVGTRRFHIAKLMKSHKQTKNAWWSGKSVRSAPSYLLYVYIDIIRGFLNRRHFLIVFHPSFAVPPFLVSYLALGVMFRFSFLPAGLTLTTGWEALANTSTNKRQETHNYYIIMMLHSQLDTLV